MLEVKTKNSYLNVFDNINEFTKYITTKPRKPGRANDSEDTYNTGFYGTKNFNEAIDLIKYGDEDLFKKIKDKKVELNVDKILGNARRRPEYKNNVCGFMPNVPAFLVGNPRNMIDIEKQMKNSSRILNIFLNIRVDGGCSANTIIETGTKYLVIIDVLEKMGYRCNLYSGIANSRWGDHHSCLMIKIKTDKEPLNLKKICFTIAHPSMQRRLKFKWQEVNDDNFDFSNNGYGSSETEDYINKMLQKQLRDNFMIWAYEDDAGSSVEDIIKNLKVKYGIDIKEEN